MNFVKFLFLLGCVFPTFVTAETRRYSVTTGETIVISQPHRYEKTCELIPPKLSLKRPPRLGAVLIRQAEYKLGDYGGGEQKFGDGKKDPCAGKPATGPQVIYRAGQEIGVDRFRLKADFDFKRVFTVNYIIEIK